MTNLYRRSEKPRRGLWFATALCVALILFDWVSGGAARSVARRAVAHLSGYAVSFLDSAASSGIFSSRRALARDNEALRLELAALREETARARALEGENQILRELARVAESAQGITAPVLSSFRASPYGTFIVGAGEEDGVSEGSVVLTQGGFVLGRVTEAGQHNSTVKALLSPGVETDVVAGEAGAALRGEGGGNGFLRVSREATVALGDAVRAPFFGGRPVGIVADIERDEASPSAEVFVRIPVNLETLRFVFVEL